MDFLQGLQINEVTPLMSITDVEKAGQSFSNKENEDKENLSELEKTKELENTNSGGLMPITGLVETINEEEVRKKEIEKTTPTSEYLALLKEIQEKTGELEDFTPDEFKGDKDEFIEILESIVYKNAEEKANEYIKENLPADYQKYLELVDSGVSEQDSADLIKNLKSISNITSEKLDESEDLAKSTYAQYLKLTSSWNDNKIKKEVERLTELGTIIEEAKESLPELTQIITNRETYLKAEAKKAEEAERIKKEKEIKQTKEFLENTEEIAGIKFNKKMKDNWIKQYTPVKTPDGQLTTPLGLKQSYNPQEFLALVNFYDSIGLFKYDNKSKKFNPDFSFLKSLGTKEAVNQLSSALTAEKNKAISKTGYSGDQDEVKQEELIKRFEQIQQTWEKQKLANNKY